MSLVRLTQDNPAGTTFWLSTGTHTLGTGEFDQVIPKPNNVYVGAPGAVLDGQGINRAPFSGRALAEAGVEDLAGVGPGGQDRVVAEHSGVAEGGALLGLADHLTDRGVHVDHQATRAGRGAHRPCPGERMAHDGFELADVAKAVKARRNVPSVVGAITRKGSTRWVPPERRMSTWSMWLAPPTMA